MQERPARRGTVIEHRKAHADPLLAFEAEVEAAPLSDAVAERPPAGDLPAALEAYPPQTRDRADAAPRTVVTAAVLRSAIPMTPPAHRPGMALLGPAALVCGVLVMMAFGISTLVNEPESPEVPDQFLTTNPPSPASEFSTFPVSPADHASAAEQGDPAGASSPEPSTPSFEPPVRMPESMAEVRVPVEGRAPVAVGPSPERDASLQASVAERDRLVERETPLPSSLPAAGPSGTPLEASGRFPEGVTRPVAPLETETPGEPVALLAPSIPPVLEAGPSPAAVAPVATDPASGNPAIRGEDTLPPIDVAPVVSAEEAVRRTVFRYAQAFEAMDVRAAAQVWPSVDQRALARAFRGLESQQVTFESCDIDVVQTRAVADCRGTVRYVGRLGDGAPRTENHRWLVRLSRLGNDWSIERLEASRP
jgi:hypothetical protein